MVDICAKHAMVTNTRKLSFMVVNSSDIDKVPISVGNCRIEYFVKHT